MKLKLNINSISTKIMSLIGLILVLSLSLLSLISYYNISKVIEHDTEEIMMANLKNAHDKVNLWVSLRKTEVKSIAQNPMLEAGNRSEAVAYLGQMALANKDIYNKFFWTEPSGYTERTTGSKIFYDQVTDRKYFQEPMKTGTMANDIIVSRADGKTSFVVTAPVKRNDHIVGLVGGTMDIETLIKEITEINIGKTGYVMIIDQTGMVVAHPDKERINKSNFLSDPQYTDSFKAIVQKMIQRESGLAKYIASDHSEKYVAYMPVENMPWAIAVNIKTEEVDAPLVLLKQMFAITTIITLLFALGITVYLVRKMIKPIPLLQNWAEEIAAGNLTKSQLQVDSTDELGVLADTFQDMTAKLNELVSEVNGASSSVSAASQQLAANAEQTAQASRSVAKEINDVSVKTSEQIKLVNQSSRIAADMSRKIHDITASNNLLIEMSDKSHQATLNGNKAVQQAIDQMSNIEKTTNRLSDVIHVLGSKSQQINEMIAMISGIAGQTNLLALNAAIEAARAGEQGKGFAVVAEEVRKLAEQSQVAAQQIAELIGEIELDNQKTMAAMQVGSQEVSKGTEIVKTASIAFADIDKLSSQMTQLIERSTQAIQEVAKDSTTITQANGSLNHFSQQIAQNTETVSQATQQQLATIEEINESCHSLTQMTEKLYEAVNKFKV